MTQIILITTVFKLRSDCWKTLTRPDLKSLEAAARPEAPAPMMITLGMLILIFELCTFKVKQSKINLQNCKMVILTVNSQRKCRCIKPKFTDKNRFKSCGIQKQVTKQVLRSFDARNEETS